MKVYKFGGASVRSADGVRNLAAVVAAELGRCEGSVDELRLVVVVSAMGKTTNALEAVVEALMAGDTARAAQLLAVSESYHRAIAEELFGDVPERVGELFAELGALVASGAGCENTENQTISIEGYSDAPVASGAVPDAVSGDRAGRSGGVSGGQAAVRCSGAREYDRWYDAIVSYGELISTTIVSEHLTRVGLANRRLDMRRCLITDARFREAGIDFAASELCLRRETAGASEPVWVGQGFIGATVDGQPTTLGREGSDYSAAVLAYLLDAESVTIWKDVEGILNADPRIFPDAVYIPELTYLDAIELAYGGAQIIHPKTIKPLYNKHIPLYVRPFAEPDKPGSVIRSEMAAPIDVPILIVKHDQALVSVRPNDFSFVLQERLGEIISHFESNRVKINLIQSSAVNLSLCVDNSRTLGEAIASLDGSFRVVYNDGMKLLTVRGYTPELLSRYEDRQGVFLMQKTRRIMRVVLRSDSLDEKTG